jgi:hypothetical protein
VKNLMKRASSHEDRFPKTLFASFGDLLSQSQMHVEKRDEVASEMQQQKWRNLDALVFSWLLMNGKRRPQAWGALGRISVDYSRAHHSPVAIVSSHHATPCPNPAPPGEVRRASTRVCLPLSPLLHTLASA